MSLSGTDAAPPLLTFSKRLILCTGIHAIIVGPALVLNLLLALEVLPNTSALQRTADWAGQLLWRPIHGLIEDSIAIFFMLIPLNSLFYGIMTAAVWHVVRRGYAAR